MKRSSKTAPRDGAPRSAAERVLREVSERSVGILRAVTCLANVKLGALRAKGRKEIWGIASRRKEGRKKERKRAEKGRDERRKEEMKGRK